MSASVVVILLPSIAIGLAVGSLIIAARTIREYRRASRVEHVPAMVDLEPRNGQFARCDIQTIVHRAAAHSCARATMRSVRIHIDSTTHASVFADERQVVQLLSKLIDHGLDLALSNGEILISAVVRDQDVRFAVAEIGRGLLPSQISYLFDRYHAAEEHASDDGLYSCRRIVARHRGRIGVLGVVGSGCTLWFTIPTWRSVDP